MSSSPEARIPPSRYSVFPVRSRQMQNETPGGATNSPAVGLFQKAHGKMVMLQRLDAQLASLLEQRRKIQEELTSTQSQINDEFDRVMRQAEEAPARILSEIAESVRGGTARPTNRLAEHSEPANA